VLLCVNYDGVLLRCLEREDADKVLKEHHDGPVGGHFVGNTTTRKILRVEYYWLTLFRYSHTYERNCKTCQMSMEREKREVFPLQPMAISIPFEQCGLDVIGGIILISSKQHKYILTTTSYFTKWEEAVPLTHVNEKVVIQFIEKQLITRFNMPFVLIFYNSTYFYYTLLTEFALDKGIIIRYSTNYYPRGNGAT
jgi:hypothetical protein